MFKVSLEVIFQSSCRKNGPVFPAVLIRNHGRRDGHAGRISQQQGREAGAGGGVRNAQHRPGIPRADVGAGRVEAPAFRRRCCNPRCSAAAPASRRRSSGCACPSPSSGYRTFQRSCRSRRLPTSLPKLWTLASKPLTCGTPFVRYEGKLNIWKPFTESCSGVWVRELFERLKP